MEAFHIVDGIAQTLETAPPHPARMRKLETKNPNQSADQCCGFGRFYSGADFFKSAVSRSLHYKQNFAPSFYKEFFLSKKVYETFSIYEWQSEHICISTIHHINH
jgi:hypothetical protein